MARKNKRAPQNVIVLRDGEYGMEFYERFATVDEAKTYIAQRVEVGYDCDDEAQAYFIAPLAYKVNVTRKVEVTLAEEAV
jgi:hypothetical protein